jgi:hypothetical protein
MVEGAFLEFLEQCDSGGGRILYLHFAGLEFLHKVRC